MTSVIDRPSNCAAEINGRPPEIPSLTGMRFFAAICVVISHFIQRGLLQLPESLWRFLDGGRPAVAFFFTLSGFILAYNYGGKKVSKPKFYRARFARIYPVHLLCLLIASITAVVLLHNQDSIHLLECFALKSHFGVALSSALAAQITLLTAWLPFAAINKPFNGPAWSISCEAFFYLTLPYLLRRLKVLSIPALIALMCAGWLIEGSFIAFLSHFAPDHRRVFLIAQLPLVHFPEFLSGVACGLLCLYGKITVLSGKYRAEWVFCGCFLVNCLIALHKWPMPQEYLQAPFYVLMILAVAMRPSGFRIFSLAPVVLLGEASFSLYLLHIPIADLLLAAGMPPVFGPLLFVAIILLSIFVLRFYEEPMRVRITQKKSPTKVFVAQPVLVNVGEQYQES